MSLSGEARARWREDGDLLFMIKEKLVAQMFSVKFKVMPALGVGMFLGEAAAGVPRCREGALCYIPEQSWL